MSGPLPHRISKPWGHEEIWAQTDVYVGKMLVIREGHRLSLQHHRQKQETLRIMTGSVRLVVGTSTTTLSERVLGPGDVVHLPPGTVHRIEALEDAEIVEVSTPELHDVVRHEDDYGRLEIDSSGPSET